MSLNVLVAGQGPSLLLLHGFLGTARAWQTQVQAWQTRYRVIAPDLLGHGGSEAPYEPRAYALERQAEGLAQLLELLDAAPTTVIGYSMGARLALVLALGHPRLVARLVLESPSAGIEDPVAREARRTADEGLARTIERDGLAPFVDDWEQQPLFASHAALAPGIREAQRRMRVAHDGAAIAASLRGAGQGSMSPLQDRLAEVTCPTLVIAGALDATGWARAHEVATGLPGARLEVVADAGHTPHLEAPDAFEALVSAFLAHAPQASGTTDPSAPTERIEPPGRAGARARH